MSARLLSHIGEASVLASKRPALMAISKASIGALQTGSEKLRPTRDSRLIQGLPEAI